MARVAADFVTTAMVGLRGSSGGVFSVEVSEWYSCCSRLTLTWAVLMVAIGDVTSEGVIAVVTEWVYNDSRGL